MGSQDAEPDYVLPSDMEKREEGSSAGSSDTANVGVVREEKFTFWALCGIALSTGESWVAVGNTLVSISKRASSPPLLTG
jgi:hypothetical protein